MSLLPFNEGQLNSHTSSMVKEYLYFVFPVHLHTYAFYPRTTSGNKVCFGVFLGGGGFKLIICIAFLDQQHFFKNKLVFILFDYKEMSLTIIRNQS